MQNLLDDLKELCQQDARLLVEGRLLKNKIIELALKLDGNLIKLLLSHPRLRQHFFVEVGRIGNPTEERNANPTQERNANPTQERNANPTQERNANPTEERNNVPTEERNANPTQDRITNPTQERNANPTQERNANPTQDRITNPIYVVFDKEKFLQFVSNKAFLPDSYTAFSNKIGLTDDNGRTHLSRHRDVVLAWPYKDCVLEGGQTKDDAKRDEVFWNITLAPDDIDRLLDPKVLTNFRRIDADGERPATEVAASDNLIIKGNNLLALHSLLPRLRGRVKLIYIDPPYNT
ncbi:MAG: site-specific DNA-methyltransferase, partial [Chloroflexota bacterium]|nr:site-specific DNA-methyltransferase [Chloroflexota bacterium]